MKEGDWVRRKGTAFFQEVLSQNGDKIVLRHYDQDMIYDQDIEYDYNPEEWEVKEV